MRRIVLSSLLTLAMATTAGATDIDLKVGSRTFGPDHERWPELGIGLRFGPDQWRIKPTVGAGWAWGIPYGGSVIEGSAGVGGDLPHRGRTTVSWGVGYAYLDLDYGVNQGNADAAYLEFGLRWVRPADVDFGVSLRFVDGADIVLHSPGYGEPDYRFTEPISTVVLSFLMRW